MTRIICIWNIFNIIIITIILYLDNGTSKVNWYQCNRIVNTVVTVLSNNVYTKL